MGDVQIPTRLEQDHVQTAFRQLFGSPRSRGSGADDDGVVRQFACAHTYSSRFTRAPWFFVGSGHRDNRTECTKGYACPPPFTPL